MFIVEILMDICYNINEEINYIMIHLLKIIASGYKMLSDNFTVDFISKAKSFEDLESEVFNIDENLYAFNIMAYTGSNSSGKTTVLNLIKNCLLLMQTGRWIYNKNDFKKDKIDIYIEFYFDGVIYIYESSVYPCDTLNFENTDMFIPFCKIINEKIKYGNYKPYYGKGYLKKISFKEMNMPSGIEDTSALQFWCKDNIVFDFMSANSYATVREQFFSNFNLYNKELITAIIKLLDDSIEYINYTTGKMILFKRIDEEELLLSKSDLLGYLSNGTIKGIELYIRVISILKKGGYFIIDEMENCFHKNLVNNVLYLFNDPKTNPLNAKIIFSTHYVEILDALNRRDNINVLHKNKTIIENSNLYLDYNIRSEILKSKQFNNNTFNTLLNSDNLMILKRMVKNEVSNND